MTDHEKTLTDAGLHLEFWDTIKSWVLKRGTGLSSTIMICYTGNRAEAARQGAAYATVTYRKIGK